MITWVVVGIIICLLYRRKRLKDMEKRIESLRKRIRVLELQAKYMDD